MLGAVFGVISFISTSVNNLYSQTRTCYGSNLELFEALVKQRNNAVLSFILIFLESLIQLLLYFVPECYLNKSKGAFIFAIISIIYILFLICKKTVNSISTRTIKLQKEKIKGNHMSNQ